MQAENLTEILRRHPFLAQLSDEHMEILVGCASNVQFPEGTYVIHEGQVADKLYLIRSGRVALEMHDSPRGPIRIQTVGPGEVLGWSWLIFPFRWHFSGCAVADVHAFALDGECLRMKCDNDHDFGFEMMKRLALIMERRLEATRLQLLDVYGTAPGVQS